MELQNWVTDTGAKSPVCLMILIYCGAPRLGIRQEVYWRWWYQKAAYSDIAISGGNRITKFCCLGPYWNSLVLGIRKKWCSTVLVQKILDYAWQLIATWPLLLPVYVSFLTYKVEIITLIYGRGEQCQDLSEVNETPPLGKMEEEAPENSVREINDVLNGYFLKNSNLIPPKAQWTK